MTDETWTPEVPERVNWQDVRVGDVVSCTIPARGIVTAIDPHPRHSGMRTYTVHVTDADLADLTWGVGGLVVVDRWGRQPR